MQVTTVGLDIAKNLFQVHGADAQGRPVLKRKLARGKVLEFFATLPACLVGLEACGAAHYWARELAKLGHTVRLMAPQYMRRDLEAHSRIRVNGAGRRDAGHARRSRCMEARA